MEDEEMEAEAEDEDEAEDEAERDADVPVLLAVCFISSREEETMGGGGRTSYKLGRSAA